ncbi:hypothetical protein LTR85_000060 [Meristemomyces frigidus]|nr:hypothetical protein LTR85_000060 [Meristemomyces frigidus]
MTWTPLRCVATLDVSSTPFLGPASRGPTDASQSSNTAPVDTCAALDLGQLFGQHGGLVLSVPIVQETALGSIVEVLERRTYCHFCTAFAQKIRVEIESGRLKVDSTDYQITMYDSTPGGAAWYSFIAPSTANASATSCLLSFHRRWLQYFEQASFSNDYYGHVAEEARVEGANILGCETWTCDVLIRVPREGRKKQCGKILLTLAQLSDPIRHREDQQLFERRLSASGPDLALLHSWVRTCVAEHGDLCARPLRIMRKA